VIEDADLLVEHAARRLEAGDGRDAIDLLRRALTDDPDHARGHAVLALALIAGDRFAAAELEARTALSLDGGSIDGHHAMAAALHARGKHAEAWEHCQVALMPALDLGTAAAIRLLGAAIRTARGEHAEARMLLVELLAGHPTHTGARVALARLELAAGRLADAARHADVALRESPKHVGAHAIAGMVDLAEGDAVAAERHARFALSQDDRDREAIRLWVAIRSRRSRLLGVIWRFHTWVSLRTEERRTLLLISTFLIAQLAVVVVSVVGLPELARIIVWTWAVGCLYVVFAPWLFDKLIERGIGSRP